MSRTYWSCVAAILADKFNCILKAFNVLFIARLNVCVKWTNNIRSLMLLPFKWKCVRNKSIIWDSNIYIYIYNQCWFGEKKYVTLFGFDWRGLLKYTYSHSSCLPSILITHTCTTKCTYWWSSIVEGKHHRLRATGHWFWGAFWSANPCMVFVTRRPTF